MKTSELTGKALDWAVGKAANLEVDILMSSANEIVVVIGNINKEICKEFCPSISWADGGPIIEREDMLIRPRIGHAMWQAWKRGVDEGHFSAGPTPLIAAMRCYVASRLGNEIDIPEELE